MQKHLRVNLDTAKGAQDVQEIARRNSPIYTCMMKHDHVLLFVPGTSLEKVAAALARYGYETIIEEGSIEAMGYNLVEDDSP